MLEPKEQLDHRAAALEYAAAGFPVFPVNCRSKRPLIKRWPTIATTDPEQIEAWWTAHPDAMIGMPTGSRSGLVVVDFDAYKGTSAEDSMERLADQLGGLPLTATARSLRGGFHYFFLSPSRRLRTGANVLGHGIDFLGEGRFIVVPPSSGQGGAYRWEYPREGIIPSLAHVVDLPAPWVEELTRKEVRCGPRKRPSSLEDKENLHSYGCTTLTGPDGETVLPLVITPRQNGKWITSAMRDPSVISAVLRLLNIRTPERFRCVIPGHAERKPSASIAHGDNGVAMYRDWHGRSRLVASGHPEQRRHTFFLGEVYAFQKAGEEFDMNAPERCLWSTRLLIEANAIASPELSFPPLPPPPLAPVLARWVWEGFHLLLRCRALCMADSPTPFTQVFGSRWCGLSVEAFKAGKKWLVEYKYLVPRGRSGLAKTYVPSDGSGAEIAAPSCATPSAPGIRCG